jgi:hypothetical protein
LQQNSIRVALYRLQKLLIPQIADGIYHWNRKYDCFLGYMAGMIEENDLAAPDSSSNGP